MSVVYATPDTGENPFHQSIIDSNVGHLIYLIYQTEF